MPIHDIFSKRQRKLRGEIPDIYIYDKLPQSLRVQILHIISDTIENYHYESYAVDPIYSVPTFILRREYGVFKLVDNYGREPKYEILDFIEKNQDVEKVLDGIELIFEGIDTSFRNYIEEIGGVEDGMLSSDEAIEDLNSRFKEHGIGFAFESGVIIRVDSTYTHSEIIKPTLSLLSNSKFAGANDEYLTAHEHYRHGRNKECLTECLKAFESTMKSICTAKSWDYDPAKDTASKLIQICFANQLVPSFMQNHINALKNVLETGIPTMRNKLSGHGQGAVPRDVEDDFARYALNLTGSNIIFLVEQSEVA